MFITQRIGLVVAAIIGLAGGVPTELKAAPHIPLGSVNTTQEFYIRMSVIGGSKQYNNWACK